MLRLFLLLFITITRLNQIQSALLRTWDQKGAPRDIFIEGSLLSNKTLDGENAGIFFDKYSEDEEQISVIEDLPDVKNLWMYYIGQEIIVALRNLPKLEEIDISRNELVYVSTQMFSKVPLKRIWVNNNKIKIIENKSFGKEVNLVSLQCNKLDSIQIEWFQDPSKLDYLDLLGNDIKVLNPGIFKRFLNLNHIDLSFNNIHTIGDGAFQARNHYNLINLAYNQITNIDPDVFLRRIKIVKLDLRYNELTFLSKNLTDRLVVEHTPLIDGNPWQCLCYLNHIIKWVNWEKYGAGVSQPKDREGEPRCVNPTNPTGTCVEKVDKELIKYYKDNSSPPPNTKEKYCPCRRVGKNHDECFFV